MLTIFIVIWLILPDSLERKGLLSARVGNTFSLADREMKNMNGTSHTHMVKYPKTCKY